MTKYKLTDEELDELRKSSKKSRAGILGGAGALVSSNLGGIVLQKNVKGFKNPNNRLNRSLENIVSKKLGKGVDYTGYGLPAYYLNSKESNTIGINGSNQMDQALLAHELGHAVEHHGGKIRSNIQSLGAGIGNTYQLIGLPLHSGINAKLGVKAGYEDAIRKYQGGKDSKSNKVRKVKLIGGSILPLGLMANEVAASHRGLKLLKQAGATKSELGTARRDLMKAGGTYALAYGMPGLTALVSYLIGKRMGKKAIIQAMKNKYPKLTDKQIEDIYKKEKLKHEVKNHK